MAWVAIEDVIFHLPDDYFEVYLAYQKRIYGQKYDAKERWDICYEATKKAFPMPIGLLFVDEKFDAGAKTRVRNRSGKIVLCNTFHHDYIILYLKNLFYVVRKSAKIWSGYLNIRPVYE